MSEENAKMITEALRSVVTPGEAIPLGEAIDLLIERARAEEREACVQIAWQVLLDGARGDPIASDAGAEIETQIRARAPALPPTLDTLDRPQDEHSVLPELAE